MFVARHLVARAPASVGSAVSFGVPIVSYASIDRRLLIDDAD